MPRSAQLYPSHCSVRADVLQYRTEELRSNAVPGELDDTPRRVVTRKELHRLVPLGDTTIWELEQRGEFPRRFPLTPRCIVWDLAEVEAWLQSRMAAGKLKASAPRPAPDVRSRRTRPVKGRDQTPATISTEE
ncbi:helix-turn-helix transcriptional regulator [Sphingobium sp. AP50]|uniref:helix-turn-helix transcriptional regulator n=1 Tax=Sphingobium sp. AP50 TaxID=1884369 RepID=UPI000B89333C|nr:AlpA family phage regulatory protein [Sphingobium sp. AP50]